MTDLLFIMSFVCQSQNSSLFFKSANFLRVQSRHLFGFRKKDPKSSRHVTRPQQDPSGADGVSKSSKNYVVRRQFIPMTRRALVKRIIHEENVVTSADKGHYHNFAVALDAYVGKKFNSVLGDFKVGGHVVRRSKFNRVKNSKGLFMGLAWVPKILLTYFSH